MIANIWGIRYPMERLPKKQHLETLNRIIERSNFLSGDEDAAIISKLTCSDIKFGYGLPINIKAICKPKYIEVYLINLVHQWSCKE